jgi:hypothetical protein
VKVGSSNDPARRLAELQTGSPHRLWIDYRVAVSGCASQVEFAAHDILAAHRGLGEWFAVPTEAAIAAIHAAAFRLGVTLAGSPDQAVTPDWGRRMAGAAVLAIPFWTSLALGHPIPAMIYMIIALAGFVFSLLRANPDVGRPSAIALRWVGAASAGAALAAVPAAIVASAFV